VKNACFNAGVLCALIGFVYGVVEAFQYHKVGEWKPDTFYELFPKGGEVRSWLDNPKSMYDLHEVVQSLFDAVPVFAACFILGVLFTMISFSIAKPKE